MSIKNTYNINQADKLRQLHDDDDGFSRTISVYIQKILVLMNITFNFRFFCTFKIMFLCFSKKCIYLCIVVNLKELWGFQLFFLYKEIIY